MIAMLIRNVHIENDASATDIRIENGVFTCIAPFMEPYEHETVIDGAGALLLPPFVDSHVHLDATLTAGQPEWNETGTLFDGIRIWSERKQTLSREDVLTRAEAAVTMMAGNGIQFIRTHVDVTDPDLIALQALLELKEKVRDVADIQIVAFPQEGILSYPRGQALMMEAIRLGADAVGAIPHFEFNRNYGVESLKFIMDLAEQHGLLVDVHCDEIDDPSSRNLEVLATLAYERDMGPRVTASHTTAMGSYNDAYAYKLFRLLGMSGMNFVSNPLVNMHLGGRFDTYPKRRGLTRVKELTESGINVSFGEDDIQDPWSPLGAGNMLDVMHMGVYAAQLMGYTQIKESYRYATHNGARTLNLGDGYGIAVGRPANCILLDAPNFFDALNTHAVVLANIREGRIIAQSHSPNTAVFRTS